MCHLTLPLSYVRQHMQRTACLLITALHVIATALASLALQHESVKLDVQTVLALQYRSVKIHLPTTWQASASGILLSVARQQHHMSPEPPGIMQL